MAERVKFCVASLRAALDYVEKNTMRELFESTIERLLADIVSPELIRHSEFGHWPSEVWAAIEASGFVVAAAPESLGGADASWEDLYGVVKAAGRHNLPLPLPESLLANWLLGQCGLEARNEPIGIAMRSTLKLDHGRTTGALFDTPWIAPTDTRVSGTLLDVPWGRNVNHVVAVIPAERPVLLLMARSDAVINTKLNTAGEPRDDLSFENATPIAAANLPTHLSHDVLWWGGAMLRTAQIAGALEATMELSIRYATERIQFGKPISAFQAIQHQLAQMAQQTGSTVVSAEAAFTESNTQLAALQIAAAKICSAEAAGTVAAMAHAVHGAIGFTHEHALQQGTRRLWAWRSEFGNLGHWAQRLGGAVAQGGAAALWPSVTSGQLATLSTSQVDKL